MRNRIGTRSFAWLLACATLLIVVGTTLFHPRQSKPTDLNGRFTKTQMLAQSEPLLQALLAGASTIETVLSPVTTFASTGEPVHHWNIDSTDPKSGDMAHLLWNADTGELLRATQLRYQETHFSTETPSAQKEPTGLAWDWFHAMNIGQPREEWHIVAMRQRLYSNWDFCFRSGDHYAILTIKSTTGQLVQALCGHLPSPNMAWAPFKKGRVS